MERSLGSLLLGRPFWRRFLAVSLAFTLGGSIVVTVVWQLTGSETATWIALFAGIVVAGLAARTQPSMEQPQPRTHWISALGAFVVVIALDIAYVLLPTRPLRHDVRGLGGPALVDWLFISVTLTAMKGTFLALEASRERRSA